MSAEGYNGVTERQLKVSKRQAAFQGEAKKIAGIQLSVRRMRRNLGEV